MANDAVPIGAADGVVTAGSSIPVASSVDWMWDIAGVGGKLMMLGNGDRATLRRMPLKPELAADGVIIKLLMMADIPDHIFKFDRDRWRMMMHVAALISGTANTHAHDSRWSFGRALFDAKYSENRLLRLLAARNDAMTDHVQRAARILAPERKPVNLWTLYDLLGRNEEKADEARIRIAQEFYTAKARSKKKGDSRDD